MIRFELFHLTLKNADEAIGASSGRGSGVK